MILQQCPHAKKVMGFKGWLSVGRCVQKDEKGLRINARFEKNKQDEKIPHIAENENSKHCKKKKDREYRRISVFDISQTAGLDKGEITVPLINGTVAANPFETTMLEGTVNNHEKILEMLQETSPLPIHFRHMHIDSTCVETGIIIREGMSQLHTNRTIVNQISKAWLHASCCGQEDIEIIAESVTFITAQYLGLDTSDFSFHYIAKYSYGKEEKSLKQFLNTIQRTALHFIDSIDGFLESQRIEYDTSEYFLLSNQKTAKRLFFAGQPVYLVYPGKGELFATESKQISEHDGPYAVEQTVWNESYQIAA